MPSLATTRLVHLAVLALLLTSWPGLSGCVVEAPPEPPGAVAIRLMVLLKDPDAEVRRSAVLSLGKIGLPETASALIEALDDADPEVRQSSAWALGNLGDAAADQAAHTLARKLRDSCPAVKFAAALALGKLLGASGGPPTIVEMLTEMLRDLDAPTRRAAAQALASLEAASAYAALAKALRDKDPLVRQSALSALGELADTRTLPAMQDRLLRDPDPGVRSEAAFRLGKVGDDSVLAVLRLMSLKDESPEVRRWASWAMASIQGSSQ